MSNKHMSCFVCPFVSRIAVVTFFIASLMIRNRFIIVKMFDDGRIRKRYEVKMDFAVVICQNDRFDFFRHLAQQYDNHLPASVHYQNEDAPGYHGFLRLQGQVVFSSITIFSSTSSSNATASVGGTARSYKSPAMTTASGFSSSDRLNELIKYIALSVCHINTLNKLT